MAHPVTIDLDKGGRQQQIHRTWRGPSLGWLETDEPTNLIYTLSGGNQTLTIGIKPPLTIPLWLTVRAWSLFSELQGSIAIDVWRLPQSTWLAGTPPTVANSITGSDVPTLTNQFAAQSTALTGWTKELNQNDILLFNVQSATSIVHCTLTLECLKMHGVGE